MTFPAEDLEDDDDRRAWARAGVPADEVDAWRRWHIAPASAGAWRRGGVDDALGAAQWETAGVTPATVAAWVDEGISPSEAVRWHEFGFDLTAAKAERAAGRDALQALAALRGQAFPGPPVISPGMNIGIAASSVHFASTGSLQDPRAQALQRFMSSGVDQRLLHDYLRRQWLDDDALAWARWGITPTEADIWHDLGLTAAEAGSLAAQGRSPAQVIREWWSTGIPFDEIAEWIGAGLTAAEAIEQMAKGVTTEQAAALRALRPEADPTSADRRPSVLMERRGGPGSEPAGPPPEDEEAARKDITETFVHMLGTYDEQGGLELVDGGSNLGPSIETARARVLGGSHSAVTVTVTGIRFVNDHLARVAYDLDVRGQMNTQLRDRVGDARLIDGRWLAGRDTVTELLTMAGAQCPPPPERPRPAD